LELENHLLHGDMDLSLINDMQPHVFVWHQGSELNKSQLQFLENDKESIFYKTLSVNNYGVKGIHLHNIQLDRSRFGVFIIIYMKP